MTDHRIDTESSASRQYFIDSGRYLTRDGEDPKEVIREALEAHKDEVLDFAAAFLAMLGSKDEWGSDELESVAGGLSDLSEACGLPRSADQEDEDLLFYGVAWGSINGHAFDAGTFIRPTCSECCEKISADDMRADFGMCGSCLHDAIRSGWTPTTTTTR